MPTFNNMEEFFALLPSAIDRALAKAANDVAIEVQIKAQDKLGTYQQGWEELAESTQQDRASRGYSSDEPLLRGGTLRVSIDRDASPIPGGHRATVGSNAPQARVQELGGQAGHAYIPPRPYLAPAVVELEDEIQKTVAEYIVKELQEL